MAKAQATMPAHKAGRSGIFIGAPSSSDGSSARPVPHVCVAPHAAVQVHLPAHARRRPQGAAGRDRVDHLCMAAEAVSSSTFELAGTMRIGSAKLCKVKALEWR